MQNPKLTITLDTNFLPEFIGNASGMPSCVGGVEIRTLDHKIVCSNILDKRFEQAYQDQLPEIRRQLFS